MQTIASVFGLIVISSPLFAAVTAYVPTCCNSQSTVSVISTTQNLVYSGFNVGAGAYDIAFTPDGSTAWVTETGHALTVLSLPSFSISGTISLPLQPWLVQASPDGKTVYVIIGNFAGNLNRWPAFLIGIDVKTLAVTLNVEIPNRGIAWTGLAISPDSTRVYATFDSSTVIVCDVPSHSVVNTWSVSGPLVWTASGTLTLSPDGRTLYTSGQVLTALNTATGNVIGTVTPPGFSSQYSFAGTAVTSDGSKLYASYASEIGVGSGLAVIDAASLTTTASALMGGEFQQPVLSRDSSTVYIPDAVDSVIYAVDSATLAMSGQIAVTGPVATATLGVQGQSLFVPNQSTAGVTAVDPLTLSVIGQTTVASVPSAAVSVMNGSEVFVTGNLSNSVSGINTRSNRTNRSFTVGDYSESVTGYNPTLIAATPDGKQLYAGSSADQFQFVEIDVATGKTTGINCPYSYCDAVSVVAAPDSKQVYIDGYIDNFEGPVPPFLLVIDTATKKVVGRTRLQTAGALAVAPSGSYLYVAAGASVLIYNPAANQFTGSIAAANVGFIAFTPDGTKAYCSAGTTVLIIDTASHVVTASVNLAPAIAGPISASPDGTQVWVALSNSTTVAVIATSDNTFQTLDLGANVNGVAFGLK